MTRHRFGIAALVVLLTSVPSLAQAPCVQGNRRPFDPWTGVTVWIDPTFNDQFMGANITDCMRDGLLLWDDAFHATPVAVTTNILDANVKVLQMPHQVYEFGETAPSAHFNVDEVNEEGFITKGTIGVADNVAVTAGYLDQNGCDRIKKLLAHELGHGYLGDNAVHTPGNSNSIMRPGIPG